ncbi:MAG: DUF928 domain-containing protein, partial [Elainellaceae cyanobacterium]
APSGVTTVSLSETDFSLTPNTTYSWQVVVVCNPNRPSESLIAEANVAVVETPDTLHNALNAADNASDRARLYAEAGFWYDALEETLVGGTSAEESIQLVLLEDLAAIESAKSVEDESSLGEFYSDRLQQVIEAIR